MTADSSNRRHRVLLLSMPFSTLHYPSIGLSLLKPALEAVSIDVTVRYEFLRFADMIGADCQALIDEAAIYHSLVGDWIFSAEAHDGDLLDLDFVTDILQHRFPAFFSLDRIHAVMTARGRAGRFLDACLDAVERDAPTIVGFTTSFQQNCASLALARRIKALWPETVVVFGGANCRGDMGVELLQQYGFIDAVCTGEGDIAFPAYAHRILANAPPVAVPGMIERVQMDDGATGIEASVVRDLDTLPYPDFGDFFAQHAASPTATLLSKPTALFETSRGCWWGQRNHCTFCGINGTEMAFRSKSQDRAYEEVAFLVRRFGADLVNVDAILDYRYFETFIPRLGSEGPAITAYYELKANITADQMTALLRAGIKKIQPGIESLDTEVLKLMRKGCTMLQNVQTLKLAAENGLFVEWNLLHGFPGEAAESYRAIAALIPKLAHLQPPAVIGPVRADRFSPYWARPASFGITVTPNPAYNYIYPFSPEVVARLAYHFDMTSPRADGVAEAVAAATDVAAVWREGHGRSSLTLRTREDGMVEVEEGRPGRTPWTRQFNGASAFLLDSCWQVRSWNWLMQTSGDAEGLRGALADLLALDLVLVEGDRVLTLALRQPGYATAPSWSDVRSARIVPFTLAERPATDCSVAAEDLA